MQTTIYFDEPRAIYYAGQTLSGRIDIEISRPQAYSAINVNFIGEAKVNWKENEFEEYNGVRRNIMVNYGGTETYFHVAQCISGGTGTPITLQPGINHIPFQFMIPHIAPSSFKSTRGSVEYKMIAYIDYPDPMMKREQIERAFDVVAPLDCNRGEDIKQPINMEFEEIYSCCCSSKPMNITIKVPHSGYCPGQTIPITISARNKTHIEISKIILQLIRKECYHSNQPRSTYIPPDQVLQAIKTKPILSKYEKEYTYYITVPDMIAPNLQNCSLIDVGFFIKAIIQPSGCNDDLEDETELCLGLIPIASTVENKPYKHPMQSDLPLAAIPEMPEIQNNVQVHDNSMHHTTAPYPSHGDSNHSVSPNIGFVIPESQTVSAASWDIQGQTGTTHVSFHVVNHTAHFRTYT